MSQKFNIYKKRDLVQVSLTCLLLLAGLLLIASGGQEWLHGIIVGQFLAIHFLMELASFILAILIITISWHNLNKDSLLLTNILVCGFTIIAGLDVFHAFSIDGMPRLFTDSGMQFVIIFWQLARFIELIIICFICAKVKLSGNRVYWLALGGVILVGLWGGTVEWHDDVPLLFNPQGGMTASGKRLDWLLVVIALVVVTFVFRYAILNKDARFAYLGASCFALSVGQISLLGSEAPTSVFAFYAHICKIVAYCLTYRAALVHGVISPYSMLKKSESKVRVHRARLAAILNSLPADVAQFDTRLLCGYVGASLCKLRGVQYSQLLGKAYTDVFPDTWVAHIQPKLERAINGHPSSVDFTVKDDKGNTSYKYAVVVPEYADDGETLGVLVLVYDRTERALNRKKIFESAEEMTRLRMALDEHAIVAITDERGVIEEVNDKFCEISQYSREELIGKTHRVINSGTHGAAFFQNLWGTIKSGEVWSGEICNRTKYGALYWVQTTIVPFIGKHGKPDQYIAIRADITSRKLAEQAVHQMAFYDFLTELPNRRLMADRVRMAQAMCERTGRHGAFMLLDLDNFKEINDTFGHEYGDELLKQMAKRLVVGLRQIDTVARVGGDEFVIILSELSNDITTATVEASEIAEKILESLSQPFALKERLCHTSASIGLVMFPGYAGKDDELIGFADMALYRAKAQGKNCISIFDVALQNEVLARTSLNLELRQALQNDEFLLHYQVVVDGERSVEGYEALLRWKHPEMGLISPVDFIPMLEQTGMIIDVGYWVLSEACSQLSKWARSSTTSQLTIAVNISAKQIKKDDFVEKVIVIVNNYSVDPRLLKFEMTESMFHADLDETIKKMNSLIDFGIRFSMDDFGTGYSSLSYLKKLPLEQLKIDKSFVKGVINDGSDAAIVLTILALAKTLSMSVVAEGVETEEQFEFLRKHGCQSFQGYLLGRPGLLGS